MTDEQQINDDDPGDDNGNIPEYGVGSDEDHGIKDSHSGNGSNEDEGESFGGDGSSKGDPQPA